MRRGNGGRCCFNGALAVLLWLFLSTCGPAAQTESRYTQEPLPTEELPPTEEAPAQEAGELPSPEDTSPAENPAPEEEFSLAAETEARESTSRSWYVSMSGSDEADGRLASPLRTIARAAALAQPGDVIRVLPGTYSEQLVLESRGAGAPAITLRGEGTVRPTLMPGNRSPGSVIFVRGRWNLENLHIDVDGAPKAAVVFLPGADESRLTGSELRDGRAGAGVIVQGPRHIRILNNIIHHFIKRGDDSHGVVVVGPSQDVVLRGNNIHHNSGDAVQCQGDTAPAQLLLIEHNQLYDNGENGVDIKECQDVVIRNNRLEGFPNAAIRPMGSSGGEAVVVSRGARRVVIQGNTISRAGRGVSVLAQVAPPEDIRIERNTIWNIRDFPRHNGQGIRVAGGRNVQVVDNTVERTASYGLMLAADGLTVHGLTVRNNRVKAGPRQLLLRLGRESSRPGLSMGGNRYSRGGALSIDGVQRKFRGSLKHYRKLFRGEHLFISSPERLEVWRRVSEVDQGSSFLE